MLPKVSGIEVCRQIRLHSDAPIITVSAKGAEIDTVVGLEVGADDYVGATKTLDVHIKRLRSRVELDSSEPIHVLTVRGVGYKFVR